MEERNAENILSVQLGDNKPDPVSIPGQEARSLFNTSNRPGLQVLPAFPNSLPINGYDWHTSPSILNSLAQGLGLLFPQRLTYEIPTHMKHTQTHTRDILVTHSLFVLLSLCPPGCCTWFLSHSSPSLSPTWLRVLTTLNSPDVPASGYALPFVFNKLSCSPFLGAVMYFPFLFLFSSFIWCPKLGVAPPIIFDSGVYLFSCFFPPPYLSLLTYSASVLSLSFCYTLLGCPPRKHFSFTCLWAYPYYIL